MGGKFSVGQALDIIDLNNDGYHDFVYDMSKVTCANAPDLGGSGGWPVTVFAGQPDGSAKEAFSNGANRGADDKRPPVFRRRWGILWAKYAW